MSRHGRIHCGIYYLRAIMAAPLWCGLGCRSRTDSSIHRSWFFFLLGIYRIYTRVILFNLVFAWHRLRTLFICVIYMRYLCRFSQEAPSRQDNLWALRPTDQTCTKHIPNIYETYIIWIWKNYMDHLLHSCQDRTVAGKATKRQDSCWQGLRLAPAWNDAALMPAISKSATMAPSSEWRSELTSGWRSS